VTRTQKKPDLTQLGTPSPTGQCSCRPRREIYKGVLYETHQSFCPVDPKTRVYR